MTILVYSMVSFISFDINFFFLLSENHKTKDLIMQSKITLQLTFNFGDQLNNDLIPKLLLKKLWMKPCAVLYLFMRIL